ncbi:MAG: hypothetical protein KC417_01105 [Myxococcales bacterium]|nr:hypothetical protein [Myxococcales bacterium]
MGGLAVLVVLGGCSWSWSDRFTGSGDGGSGDAIVDAPMEEDECAAHPEWLFCDGFESGDLSGWNGERQGNAIEVRTTPHRGRHGGYAHVNADGEQSLIEAQFPAVTSGSLYVRGYFRVPPGTTVGAMNLFSVHNTADDRVVVVLNGSEPDHLITFISSTISSGTGSSSPEGVEFDEWTCLELAIDVAASPGGNLTLSKDGVTFAEGNQTGVNTAVPGGYMRVRLPITYVKDSGLVEIYFDDIAVSTTPIGCD